MDEDSSNDETEDGPDFVGELSQANYPPNNDKSPKDSIENSTQKERRKGSTYYNHYSNRRFNRRFGINSRKIVREDDTTEKGNCEEKQMVLSGCKSDEFYSLKYNRMGTCIIFNHETYNEKTWKKKIERRKGTDKDADSLKKIFKSYGFQVRVYKDKTKAEITKILETAKNEDHEDASCFVLCVLTHGSLNKAKHDEILCAYDTHYSSNKLFSPLLGDSCPSLAGKPKLFFIQACRGGNYDEGVTVSFKNLDETDCAPLRNSDCTTTSLMYCKIPLYADCFIAYSTVSGTKAWKSQSKGSWFIQKLCETIEERAQDLDIASILTKVCYKIAFDHESHTREISTSHMKQIPSIYSTLTRRFMFPKKQPESELEPNI